MSRLDVLGDDQSRLFHLHVRQQRKKRTFSKSPTVPHRTYTRAELTSVLGEPAYEGNSLVPYVDEQGGGHIIGSPVLAVAPPPEPNQHRWMIWACEGRAPEAHAAVVRSLERLRGAAQARDSAELKRAISDAESLADKFFRDPLFCCASTREVWAQSNDAWDLYQVCAAHRAALTTEPP